MSLDPILKRILAARTALLLDQPFFGVLALHLALVDDDSARTMWTDGQSLGYSKAFVSTLNQDQLTAVIAHEVMHCAAGHPWRRDAREMKKWNAACDYAINGILTDSGFTLPADALIDSAYDGKSSEWIYDRLPDSDSDSDSDSQGNGDSDTSQDTSQDSQSGDQSDDRQPGQSDSQPGEVRDAPDDSTQSESDWQQVAKQAENIAQSQGKLPGGLKRSIDGLTAARTDWRSVLRRFVQELTNADYSWTSPNRRYIAHGLYLPSLRSHRCGRLVVAVDTSGSIDAVLLGQFQSEIRTIADDVKPSMISVVYCDARVNHVDDYAPDDLVTLTPHGGGGTSFVPVFDHVNTSDDDAPAALIYLTDMYGTFPPIAPSYPVIWCSASTVDTAPFGEVVKCNE